MAWQSSDFEEAGAVEGWFGSAPPLLCEVVTAAGFANGWGVRFPYPDLIARLPDALLL